MICWNALQLPPKWLRVKCMGSVVACLLQSMLLQCMNSETKQKMSKTCRLQQRLWSVCCGTCCRMAEHHPCNETSHSWTVSTTTFCRRRSAARSARNTVTGTNLPVSVISCTASSLHWLWTHLALTSENASITHTPNGAVLVIVYNEAPSVRVEDFFWRFSHRQQGPLRGNSP